MFGCCFVCVFFWQHIPFTPQNATPQSSNPANPSPSSGHWGSPATHLVLHGCGGAARQGSGLSAASPSSPCPSPSSSSPPPPRLPAAPPAPPPGSPAHLHSAPPIGRPLTRRPRPTRPSPSPSCRQAAGLGAGRLPLGPGLPLGLGVGGWGRLAGGQGPSGGINTQRPLHAPYVVSLNQPWLL